MDAHSAAGHASNHNMILSTGEDRDLQPHPWHTCANTNTHRGARVHAHPELTHSPTALTRRR